MNHGVVSHCIGPVKISKVSEDAKLIHKSIRWLLRRQHRDGSWGTGSGLDRVISTTHAAMALLDAGFPPAHPALEKAVRWMTVGKGSHHQWYVWRIGPLIRIPEYRSLVESDLMDMDDLVKKRAGPHRDQILPLFQLNCLKLLDRWSREDSKVNEYVKAILGQWSEEECWRNRPETTSHALALLEDFDFPDKKRIYELGIDLVVAKANVEANLHANWGGRVVCTCFVIFNIAESSLHENEQLSDLMGKAVRWLRRKCNAKGYWDSEEPPFGGDVESREYVTSAAIRALIAYNSLSNFFFPLEIIWLDRSRYARLSRILTYGVILAGTTWLALLSFEIRGCLAQVTSIAWLGSAISVVLAVIAVVAGIFGIVDFFSKRTDGK